MSPSTVKCQYYPFLTMCNFNIPIFVIVIALKYISEHAQTTLVLTVPSIHWGCGQFQPKTQVRFSLIGAPHLKMLKTQTNLEISVSCRCTWVWRKQYGIHALSFYIHLPGSTFTFLDYQYLGIPLDWRKTIISVLTSTPKRFACFRCLLPGRCSRWEFQLFLALGTSNNLRHLAVSVRLPKTFSAISFCGRGESKG